MRADEAAEKAREAIAVPWDEVRAARVQKRVASELAKPEAVGSVPPVLARGRKWRWVTVIAAALVLLAVIGVVKMRAFAPPAAGRLEFADGSIVTFEPGVRVVPEVIAAGTIQVRQAAGAASYDIAPKPERVFVVNVGDVRVEVLGTAFRIEKLPTAVHVAVTRGRVRVTRGSRTVVLLAGDEVTLNDDEPETSAAVSSPNPSSQEASSNDAAPSSAPDDASAAPSSTVLPPSSASSAVDEPSAADLFRQADDARASGNPAEALRLLRLLVQRYPHDGRITAAVFTIGRLEAQRGHLADAAAAFESCGAALQGEALAEAALARQGSGQSGRARSLAARYLELFPNGPRARELERLR